jgi:nucleoside-diphosphate-sugar epimerase
MIRDGNLQLLRDIVSDNEVLPDIVFLSTSEVYGSSMSLPIKEDQVGEIDIGISRSIYPTTKLQTELLIQDLSQTFGNRFNIFRVFHTFGPGMRHDDMRSFSSFLWSVSKGNVPRLRTSGTQIRSYLYALDFVVAILDYPISNSVINVGSPKPISVGRFAELACVLGGLDEGPIFEQSQELFLSSPNNFLVPDVVKLSNNGWSPTVDIESAITRTLAWMRNRR